MIRKSALLLLTMLSLLVLGCGDTPKKTISTRISQEGRYDFVFVCPTTKNEYWEDCIRGIKEADKLLGTRTQVIGAKYANNMETDMVTYMKAALDSKPSGIMSYMGIAALNEYITRAKREGIPIIAIDSDSIGVACNAYVGTDLYNFGYQSGVELAKATGGKAKVGYICTAKEATGEALCYGAFRDAISDFDIEVVAETIGSVSPDAAAQAAEKMLAEHPEIDAVFCTGGYNGTGAARAKEKTGRDFVLVCFEEVPENIGFVRKGVINTLLVQSPYKMGFMGVHVLKECVDRGRPSTTKYDTGSIIVTRANVDSYR